MALSLTPPNSSLLYSRSTTSSRSRQQDRPALLNNGRINYQAAFVKQVQKSLSWRPKGRKTGGQITMMPLGIPRVFYKDPLKGSIQNLDVFEALQKERMVFISDKIDEEISNQIVASLLYLDQLDSSKDLLFLINSLGGDVSPSMSIYDTMQFLKSSVSTRCIGYAFDYSALILSAGKKGNRSALSHARILLRSPIGETAGKVDNVVNETNQLIEIRNHLFDKLSKHTGRSEQKIFEDLNIGKGFNAQEAIEYGIIDEIAKPPELSEILARKANRKTAPGLG